MMDGILIVCFGTTHLDSWEKTYGAIFRDAREKYPGVPIYEAVTSGVIRKKLAETGKKTWDVISALQRMGEAGISRVLVLTTFVIAGIEYDRLLEDCRRAAPQFAALSVLPPLLAWNRRQRRYCPARGRSGRTRCWSFWATAPATGGILPTPPWNAPFGN